MRVFITGGGGFLGSVICKKLIQAGHEVISFSRNDHQSLAKLGIELKKGSITNLDAVVWAANKCDAIIHTAAKAGVWGSLDSYYEPNVIGTENIIKACREHGITRLVYTSSPSVVFNGSDMEGVNESVPYADTYEAFYPQTKAMAEQAVLEANGPNLATVALRPHLIWGPGDPHLVARIIDRGSRGKLRRIGKETKKVDSIYVDNAADAHILAMIALKPGSACAGKAYFISNNEPLPIWKLVNSILAAAGYPPVEKTISTSQAMRIATLLEKIYRLFKSETEPMLTRFVVKELSTSHWFDLTAAQNDLSYEPAVTLDEGLNRLKEWFRNRN